MIAADRNKENAAHYILPSLRIKIELFDFLYKTEHAIRKLFVSLHCHVRIVRIRVMTVEKFNDMKPAAVDIKMNIAFFKIRRNGFPYFYFRVQFFDCTPGGIADSFAVHFGRNKQQFEVSQVSIDFNDRAANRPAILHDPISFPAFDGSPDGLSGNDFTFFFEMIIPAAKFF